MRSGGKFYCRSLTGQKIGDIEIPKSDLANQRLPARVRGPDLLVPLGSRVGAPSRQTDCQTVAVNVSKTIWTHQMRPYTGTRRYPSRPCR
jgi:hypothetical protein